VNQRAQRHIIVRERQQPGSILPRVPTGIASVRCREIERLPAHGKASALELPTSVVLVQRNLSLSLARPEATFVSYLTNENVVDMT